VAALIFSCTYSVKVLLNCLLQDVLVRTPLRCTERPKPDVHLAIELQSQRNWLRVSGHLGDR
jgi:hypothetical protein